MRVQFLSLVTFSLLLLTSQGTVANSIEHNALFLEYDDYSIKNAYEFRDIVRQNGFKCEKISAYIPMTNRNGAQIQCDKFTSIYIVLRLFDEDPDIQYISVPDKFE